MPDLTGHVARGYEFGEKIGEGSFGAVYRAYQAEIDREVAIKVILPEHANQPEFIQRFRSEARIVARLEHPHIVPLYDYWQDENGVYIVMRLVRGGSLREILRQQNTLSVEQTLYLLEQIASALTAAHQAGVIHRDLKPDNILLDDRGNSYLTDFGLAKTILIDSSLISSDAVVGTPAYLAPEQALGDGVTAQTDIYSLGIMLYEMLTGERPFDDQNPLKAIMQHMQEPMPSLLEKRPDLSPRLNDVLQNATVKDPRERYNSALALASAFRSAANISDDVLSTPLVSFNPIIDYPRNDPRSIHSERPLISKVPSSTEGRNRYYMLQNVQAFWIQGVLENSLHGAALIELGLRESIGKVDNPWDILLRKPDTTDETLPPGTQILDVFDRLNGTLLILGEPGSGKTTTLLELTRDLLQRARQDNEHPIPVVFNLSSWSENRKPIEQWLVDELVGKYQAPRKVAAAWVEQNMLLPLLDGLDEVTVSYRDDCVDAINAYRTRQGFINLVVCSRTADYQSLETRLKLNGAVIIKPLNAEQVDLYLASLGEQVSGVRELLHDDELLRELSQSPLMLSIMTLAYHGIAPDTMSEANGLDDHRNRLFSAYVQRMLQRRGGNSPYDHADTLRWLSWLARIMNRRGQTVFFIEGLQPDMLPSKQQRVYMVGVRLLIGLGSGLTVGVPIGLVFGLSQALRLGGLGWVIGFGLLFGLIGGLGTGIAFGAPVGLLFGLVGGLRRKLTDKLGAGLNEINVVETLTWSWAEARSELLGGLVVGAVGGLLLAILVTYTYEITVGIGVGLAIGLSVAMAGAILNGLTGGEVELRTRPNQGIERSLKNALRVGGAFLLMVALAVTIAVTLTAGVTIGLPAVQRYGVLDGLMFTIGNVLGLSVKIGILGGVLGGLTVAGAGFLAFGGLACIQHFVLRLILLRSNFTPWNYAKFLDYAAERLFLRKVGGGYIFVHRLLMDYLAAREEHIR